jgi:ABC-2 type transport system permease protein
MKLWHSLLKEIKLATRGFYFYIEIVMAGIFLFLLLFVIPENFESKTTEYIYWDVPEAAVKFLDEKSLEIDIDQKSEIAEFELNDEVYEAVFYETDDAKVYVFDNFEIVTTLAEEDREFAAVVHMDDAGSLTYTYYLQGYETERLKNIFAVLHNEEAETILVGMDAQEVQVLHQDQILLSDRQNVIPSFLTFNGSLMGMFILVAYIFLDKKEGVIKAYAVTTSPVWQYLLSKVGVVTLTAIVSSLIITVPIMGGQANYFALIVLLLCTGFAASSAGLVLSSIYDDMMQSFGALYFLVIIFMLPNIAYFIPTWDPTWMPFIPSYQMLEGFKETLLPNGDINYVMMASLGYLVGGLVLFLFANARFKKTLTL